MPKPALASNQIIDALKQAKLNGVDVDDALDQLTVLVERAGTVKPAKTEKATKVDPARYDGMRGVRTTISESSVDGHPIVVGWSTCGECKFHVSRCECPNGPKMPEYIARWVAEFEATLAGGSPAETRLSTDVGNTEIGEGPFSPEGGSVSGDPANPKSATKSQGEGVQTGTTCVGCGKDVDGTMADLQDDGETWLCFTCQEAS